MIVLYRRESCPFCDKVEEQLKDLVLAHRVVAVRNGAAGADLPTGTALPALTEGEHLYDDERAITSFLEDLKREVTLGRQFQSDACYLDPENPRECL